jgi:hypothetical protein
MVQLAKITFSGLGLRATTCIVTIREGNPPLDRIYIY